MIGKPKENHQKIEFTIWETFTSRKISFFHGKTHHLDWATASIANCEITTSGVNNPHMCVFFESPTGYSATPSRGYRNGLVVG